MDNTKAVATESKYEIAGYDATRFAFSGRQMFGFIKPGTDAPIFIAREVCDLLGIVKVDRAVSSLDDDERSRHTVSTLGGPQEITTVSESGLYSLIMKSRKPEAKAFKRWITSEVLPSIRRTGMYRLAQEANALRTEMATALSNQAAAHTEELERSVAQVFRGLSQQSAFVRTLRDENERLKQDLFSTQKRMKSAREEAIRESSRAAGIKSGCDAAIAALVAAHAAEVKAMRDQIASLPHEPIAQIPRPVKFETWR